MKHISVAGFLSLFRFIVPVVLGIVSVAACVWPRQTHAEPLAWKIRIEAGDIDRSNLPIRAPVVVPEAAAVAQSIQITLADGSHVVGQILPPGLLEKPPSVPAKNVPRDIVFVLPRLLAGTSIDVVAEAQDDRTSANPRLHWADAAGATELLFSGKPLLRYEMPVYDASSEETRVKTYKPFHHVFDPATGIKLTKGDGGQYPHHRGIFFGYNKISHGTDKKVSSDCWHCTGKARQQHRKVLEHIDGDVEGRQRTAIDWIGSDESVVISETRELAAVPVAGGTIIDFASRLESTGPVRLEGDPQHAGVHFRASQEVADEAKSPTKSQTYYLRPGKKASPGDYRNWPDDKTYINAPWHAASFVVGGKRSTVLRINRPANPGEARMSERDYARFGSYCEAGVAADSPLELGYRWWVQPGEITLEEAARIAADFSSPAKVTVVPNR